MSMWTLLPLLGALDPTPRDLRVQAEVRPDGAISAQVELAEPLAENEAIPRQLFLTSAFPTIVALPGRLFQNVQRTTEQNPDLTVKWFDDNKCRGYLSQHFPELLPLFDRVKKGSNRSDICRTVVLYVEGGYYTDLDLVLERPLKTLVLPETTFLSAWAANSDFGILNAIIGTTPQNPILNATLHKMLTMDPDTDPGSWGPRTLNAGFSDVLSKCGPVPTHKSTADTSLCGQHIRMFNEINVVKGMDRNRVDPPVMFSALSNGVHDHRTWTFAGNEYGLFYLGSPQFFVGYARFSGCAEWGCGQAHLTGRPHTSGSGGLLWKLLVGLLAALLLGSWRGWLTAEGPHEKLVCGLFYCLSIFGMTLANKLAVKGAPVLLAALQMLFAAAVVCFWPGLALSRETVRQLLPWMPVCCFFAVMLVSSLFGFEHESISTCVMMSSIRPLYALAIESRFLGVTPTQVQVGGCAVLILGTAVYLLGADAKASVSLAGFLALALNGLTASADRCYQRYYLYHAPIDVSRAVLLLATNVGGLVMLALMPWLWVNELPLFQHRVALWFSGEAPQDVTVVLLSCLGGLAIGFAGIAFQRVVPASTFLAVATGCRALLLGVDHFGLGTPLSAVSGVGLAVVLTGSTICVAFAPAEQRK